MSSICHNTRINTCLIAQCSPSLSWLILVENECAHFDALTVIIIHVCRIAERRVGDSSSAAIELGIKAFDKSHLVRSLAVEEVPLVFGVGADGVSLAVTVGVYEGDRDQVRVWDRVGIGDGQGVLEDLLDGPPDVDDLVAGFQQLVGLVGEMIRDTRLGCRVALINMDSIDGSAQIDGLARVSALVLVDTADGVVEDENPRCTGPDWKR